MNSCDVFVYGYFGLNNFGDDLLALAVYENLSGRDSTSRFYFRSYGPIPSLNGKNRLRVEFTNFELELLNSQNKIIGLARYYWSHWRLFKSCRHFVLGGGSLIHGNSSSKSILILLGLLVLARLRGMNVEAYGIGVGNLKGQMSKVVAKCILSISERINVRDEGSYLACKALGVDGRLHLADDLAYTLNFEKIERFLTSPGDTRGAIGITIVEPVLNNKVFASSRRKVIAALEFAMKNWMDQGWEILLISCQEMTFPNSKRISDRDFLVELVRGCGMDRGRFNVVDLDYSKAKDVFSKVSVVVGMRFHAHLIGALYGRPFVGFSYDRKVENLCGSYGMPYRSIEEVSGPWLISSAEAALQKGLDPSVSQRHRRQAMKNFQTGIHPQCESVLE